MEIPSSLKTNSEVGMYIAVRLLGVQSHNELMKMFRYRHKRSMNRTFKKVRAIIIG